MIRPDSAAPASIPVLKHPNYHSRFGGLWTDLSDARETVATRRAAGQLSSADTALLVNWIEKGFVILPQAVPHDAIDRLDETVEQIWNGTGPARAFVEAWESGKMYTVPASAKFRDRRVKLLDLYACSPVAREIVFAAPILRFLALIFERPVVAFQSLYFRWGSQQDIHQDAAFVRVSSPMEFAASWVALEDIQPESGELEYYVGSHRLDDYLFAGGAKWMPKPFDAAVYGAFIASLAARCEQRGLERARFLPRKGDVLLWNADLAHGGAKNARAGITRKSLVTHYCPDTCDPQYGAPALRRERHSDTARYIVPPRTHRERLLAWARHGLSFQWNRPSGDGYARSAKS